MPKDPSLQVLQAEPFNAQPPLAKLLTAAVRRPSCSSSAATAPIPQSTEADYRLEVDGLVERPLALSLADLRAASRRAETTATLQCAGNRRERADRGQGRSRASCPGAPRRSATPSGAASPLRECSPQPASDPRRSAPRRLPRPRRDRAARPPLQLRRLDPARQGAARRRCCWPTTMNGAAAAARPRRPAARGGAGLHRRPQRQVALAASPCRRSPPTTTSRPRPTGSSRRTSDRDTVDWDARADARRVAGQLGDLRAARRRELRPGR